MPRKRNRKQPVPILNLRLKLPDDIRDKILQPFFTTKPTGEGTGLGLSLSYDIVVKAHDGKIDVKSKEGEFTEFKISIPV
jgi:two-component system NtrC family sensor kinase